MKKILIADDSLFMRKVLTDILKEIGHENVITASDGEEAVRKALEEKPDLVFLDVIMDKKDGLQVLKEVKGHDESIDVVIVSSVGQDDLISKAMAVGIAGYVVKPIDKEKIVSIVKEISGE